MLVHLDTDFLVHTLSVSGPERKCLRELSDSPSNIRISAIAWYEFARGPRTPEQLAVARSFFLDDGIVPFSEEISSLTAEVYRRLGSPRRRASDNCHRGDGSSHERLLDYSQPPRFRRDWRPQAGSCILIPPETGLP